MNSAEDTNACEEQLVRSKPPVKGEHGGSLTGSNSGVLDEIGATL